MARVLSRGWNELLEHRASAANLRVDKLGEVLSHDVLLGDLLQEIFPGSVLKGLNPNLFVLLSTQSLHTAEAFTFSASTNADLGEQELSGSSDEPDRATSCDWIWAKAVLREYTKNKAARQLLYFSV